MLGPDSSTADRCVTLPQIEGTLQTEIILLSFPARCRVTRPGTTFLQRALSESDRAASRTGAMACDPRV